MKLQEIEIFLLYFIVQHVAYTYTTKSTVFKQDSQTKIIASEDQKHGSDGLMGCSRICLKHEKCKSYSFDDGKQQCRIHYKTLADAMGDKDIRTSSSIKHYDVLNSKEVCEFYLENVFFQSADLSSSITGTLEECWNKCLSNSNCHAFSAILYGNNSDSSVMMCKLKDISYKNTERPATECNCNTVSAIVRQENSINCPPPEASCNGYIKKVNFQSNELNSTVTSSLQECWTKCIEDLDCHAFTAIFQVASNDYSCSLKDRNFEDSRLEDQDDVTVSGIVRISLRKTCPAPSDTTVCGTHIPNVNFQANKLYELTKATLKECWETCLGDSNCYAFTTAFLPATQNHMCYIKNNYYHTNVVAPTNDVTASGIVRLSPTVSCPAPESTEACQGYLVNNNWPNDASSVGFISTSSFQECWTECISESTCYVFTSYYNSGSNNYDCYLAKWVDWQTQTYTGIRNKDEDEFTISGIVRVGPTDVCPTPDPKTACKGYLYDTAYSGSTLIGGFMADSLEECWDECLKRSDCHAFSTVLETDSKNNCHLKTIAYYNQRTASPGVVSGVVRLAGSDITCPIPGSEQTV